MMMGKMQVMNNIAIYLRLSKEDGDGESESISNQRKINKEYIEKFYNYNNIYEYVDDGFSGSNFNRPDFNRMLKDIEEKNIQMIVVKSLSRFGRNYIESGEFIEKIFPNLGVRFVSVLDKVDNFEEFVTNDFAPIKGVFNEMYCKETSKSIKRTKRERMKEGFYACTYAPFGYRKSEREQGKLKIDNDASKVVKEIFDMKAGGYTLRQIAEYLNEKKVMTPIIYMNIKGANAGIEKLDIWKTSSVQRILSNQVYLGHCLRGKTQKISYKTQNKIHVRRNNCILVKNTHEPIIDQETFDKAHSSKYGGISKKAEINSKLINLLFCDNCKKSIGRRKDKSVKLFCRINSESKKLCDNDTRYDYDFIESIVVNDLKRLYEEHFNINTTQNQIYKKQININLKKMEQQIADIEFILKSLNLKISKIYEQRLLGKINEDEYINTYKVLTDKRKEKEIELKKNKESIEEYLKNNEFIGLKKEIKRMMKKAILGEFTKEEFSKLIERIELSKNKVHIYYKFPDFGIKEINC